MSKAALNISPAKLFLWGTMVVGCWAAFNAGNRIADDGFMQVFMAIAAAVMTFAIITVKQHWVIPVFAVGCLGFSTLLTGFKLEGADLMAAFGFACLFAMLCMGQLRPKNTYGNLGIFFYLLFFYLGAHAVLYGLDNYFAGDTQFKNIAKRYYALIAPLILILCMDRYAHPQGLRKTIGFMIPVTIVFSLVGSVISVLSVAIPGISGGVVNFAWANYQDVNGYLRGITPIMILLSLCMGESGVSKGTKLWYRFAAILLFATTLFGGGRASLISIFLYLGCWLFIRKKWRKLIFGGWLILILGSFLLVAGRTMDSRQLEKMPQSFKNVQRALSIFMPSDQLSGVNLETSTSDQWHEDLVKGSWDYANKDYQSMVFGNGYKGWDDSIDMNQFTFGEAYESAVKMAVTMGASETMFFSILPILGWVGVFLYYGFMVQLLRRNLQVMHVCPEGTLAKSLCEFSFCYQLTMVLLSPFAGGIPSYGMIFWMIGFVAAEQYIQKAPKQVIAPMMNRDHIFREQPAKS